MTTKNSCMFYRLRLSPAAQDLSPWAIHKKLFAALPDGVLDNWQPRSDAQLLWHRSYNDLIIFCRADLEFDINTETFGELIPEMSLDQIIDYHKVSSSKMMPCRIMLSRTQTKSMRGMISPEAKALLESQGISWKKHARGNRCAVPSVLTPDWAADFFARRISGSYLQNIEDMGYINLYAHKKAGVPYVICDVLVPMNDYAQLVAPGLGHAKNYGFGLLVPHSLLLG